MERLNTIFKMYKTTDSPFKFIDILFKKKKDGILKNVIEFLPLGIFSGFYIFKFYKVNN